MSTTEVKTGTNRKKVFLITLGLVLAISCIFIGLAIGGVFDTKKQLKV